MASYYGNLGSGGNMNGWYPNADCQGALDGSESLEEYLFSANGSQGPMFGAEAPLQVYDVRTIDWNTTLMETPGAYRRETATYHMSNPSAYYQDHNIREDVSESSVPVYWSATQAAAWDALQTSSGQPAASHSSAFTNMALATAENSNTRNGLLASPIPHGLPDPPRELEHATTQHLRTNSSSDPRASEDGLIPRPQDPRFAGDEYTAAWIRGDGFDRAGWCSRCNSWHKLKDSAYWYHMHYSHGISCMTGKPFDQPVAWRSTQGAIGCEALCGTCNQWVIVGRAERWRTPYFRHAYKCQVKNKPHLQRAQSRSKHASPRKPTGRLSRTR